MNDYVTKPFEESVLLKLISKYAQKNISIISGIGQTIVHDKDAKLYDLSTLKTMSHGDDEFVNKMIDLFLEQAELSITQINDANFKEDYETISKIAHKLKSSAGNMGIYSIKNDIRELERMCVEKTELEMVSSLIQKVNSTLLNVIKQLRLERSNR
jgi:HPt (histidine-containing phosphotransfer) domain-containing protein